MTAQEWSRLINALLAPHWDNYVHFNSFDGTRKPSRDIKRGIDAVRKALQEIPLMGDEHFIYRRAIQRLKASQAHFIQEQEDPYGWGLCVFSDVIGEFEYLARHFPHPSPASPTRARLKTAPKV